MYDHSTPVLTTVHGVSKRANSPVFPFQVVCYGVFY